MLDQVLKLIVDVVFGMLTYAFLLRFIMQAMRAPFRNPVGQSVIALTDWLVKPLRRVIPGLRGYDWATLLAAWAFRILWILAVFAIFGAGFDLTSPGGIAYVALLALVELFQASLWILIVAVIAQALLSWVAPDGPLAGLLNALTFPFLRPLRRRIPPIGGTLDITPIIVLVIAQIVLMGVPYVRGSLGTLLRY